MFSVSWVQSNVSKPGHGTDLSKRQMVDGACRFDIKQKPNRDIQYLSSDAIVS